jgi:hypothetical protein
MLFGLLALILTAGAAIFVIARLVLAPGAGEWAARVHLVGPVEFDVGVPTVVRLVTTSWFAPWLDGQTLDTRHGTLAFAWNANTGMLEMRCAPCSATLPALGTQPVRVERLLITVRRNVNLLTGSIEATPPAAGSAAALRARWEGRLSQKTLELSADAPDAPIASWYAVLAPQVPELQRATIRGMLALKGQLSLPAERFAVQPRLTGFAVEGLGTEAMLGARTACGPPSRLSGDSWLARAVIAAEDQRFYQHTGYDMAELAAAFEANQSKGAIERGGSTLTQQLARVLVTGSERSAERKLRELLYAVEMEQTLGKARILQLYLDNAPWGPDGLCGAEAAAKRYFKRNAARLEPAQAVWLAAMLHNPAAELDKWRSTGQIDAARAKWVAEGIRGITRGQREMVLKGVEKAKFAAP